MPRLGRVWWIRPFCHLARSGRYGDSSSGRRRRAVRRHRRLADRHSTAADRHHRRHLGRRARRAAHRPVRIRYDLPDTGRSTTVDPDSPGYKLRDLVTDAVGVLDGLGIARAHVVGIATGGSSHSSWRWTTRRGSPRSCWPAPARSRRAPSTTTCPGTPRRSWPTSAALHRSTGPTARRSWTVRWPRPACSPARHSSTPPRPRPRGRCSRPLRSAPGVGAQRPAERGVLEAGLHATLARTAPGDHRTDTAGARRSRPVLPGGQCEGAGRGDPRRNPAGPGRGRRGTPRRAHAEVVTALLAHTAQKPGGRAAPLAEPIRAGFRRDRPLT